MGVSLLVKANRAVEPGSILEFERLMISELQMGETGCKSVMIKIIRKAIREIAVEKKMKAVLPVDVASRIVSRGHMEPLSRKEMEEYLLHHL